MNARTARTAHVLINHCVASPLASRLSLVPRHFAMRASSVTRALRRDAETDGDRAFDVRATALASASSSDGGDYLILVGYEDGSLARFDVRASSSSSPTPTWIAPGSPLTDVDRADDVTRGVDATRASTKTGLVARCRGTPPTVDAVNLATGSVVKTLRLPTTWPCAGLSAVGACGGVGDFFWATSAVKWNHSGDEFYGNSATTAAWRLSGEETIPFAVFHSSAERRSLKGGMAEEKILVPFTAMRGFEDARGAATLEYLQVAINFTDEYCVLERKAYEFITNERGRTQARERDTDEPRRVDLGWIPKFGAVRNRALEREPRAMPALPHAALSDQFILVVWSDGERVVHVIDRKADASSDVRRDLFETFRHRVESCVTNPDAKTKRTVLDVGLYDGDSHLVVVTRDTPISSQASRSSRDEDVDHKLFMIPVGLKGSKPPTKPKPKPLIDVDDGASACAICLEDTSSEDVARAPCCGGTFCQSCLASYMATNAMKGCPMCRDVDSFWATNAKFSALSVGVNSFEVEMPYQMRQDLKSYRVLEQIIDGDYATLDDFHLRGDRAPLMVVPGRALTLAERGVDVRDLIPFESNPRSVAQRLPMI